LNAVHTKFPGLYVGNVNSATVKEISAMFTCIYRVDVRTASIAARSITGPRGVADMITVENVMAIVQATTTLDECLVKMHQWIADTHADDGQVAVECLCTQ
jgi:hypothetical protein